MPKKGKPGPPKPGRGKRPTKPPHKPPKGKPKGKPTVGPAAGRKAPSKPVGAAKRHAKTAPAPARPGRVRRPKKLYYVCTVETGCDSRCRKDVIRKSRIEDLEDKIGRVIIARHRSREYREGKEVWVRRKSFPGYLICHLAYDEEVFAVFKDARGFFGFLNDNKNPIPIETEEAAELLIRQRAVNQKTPGLGSNPPPSLDYKTGDAVEVVSGAFVGLAARVVKIEFPNVGVQLPLLGRMVDVSVRWDELKKED